MAVHPTFYFKWQENVNATLQALQALLLRFRDSELEETIKYGMPCFLYQEKPKFYLGVDLGKDYEPYVLFVDGDKINDSRLEQGSRKKMKIYRVNPNLDIDKDTFYELLSLSIAT